MHRWKQMFKYFLVIGLLINSIDLNAHEKNVAIERLPKNFSELKFKEVGKAQFTVLFWDIYNSALYTKSGRYSHENSPDSLIFEIEYLKDITAEDLLERTVQQWKHLNIPEVEYSQFIPRLKAIWPDISSGDKLTMLVQKKQSVFYFNQLKVGHIEQETFSKIFLDIWLSPETSQKKLRRQLLGETK
jgi:hypothetical protein